MKENLTLWLISVISTLLYIGWIYIKFGEQPSISDTVRLYKFKMLFWLFILIMGLPISILGGNLLMFLAFCLIMLVPTAWEFWKPRYEKIHVIGAVGGIGLMLVSLVVNFNAWYIVLSYMLIIMLINFKIIKLKNPTWWMELLAIFTIWFVLLFKVVLV